MKNIISYAQVKEDIISPLFATDLNLRNSSFVPFYQGLYANGGGNVDVANVFPVPGGHTANQSTFTNEFQVQGRGLGGRLNYQGGVYLEVSRPLGLQGSLSENSVFCTSLSSLVCANPLGAGSTSITDGRTSYHDVGLYSQATYSLTDRLKLTGGFRYTWDHTETSGQQINFIYNIPPGPNNPPGFPGSPLAFVPSPPIGSYCTKPESTPFDCMISIREKSSAPTWLIDLDYKPTQHILAYAKYSRGYRAGGISPTVPSQYATYGPEHLDSYEVGLKTSFGGALRGTFNVAGFYNDLRGEQTAVSFAPKITGSAAEQSGNINANKSRSYGAEVDASITPFTGFTLDGAYAYVHAKVLSIPTIVLPASSAYIPFTNAASGDFEQFSPRNKYTITATYALPLNPSVGRISVSGTFSHLDSQIGNYSCRAGTSPLAPTCSTAAAAGSGKATGVSILQARNLVDLSLNWNSIAGSTIDLTLFANNVTNQHYYTDTSGLLPSAGFDIADVGAPRMYGGRLRFRFGR